MTQHDAQGLPTSNAAAASVPGAVALSLLDALGIGVTLKDVASGAYVHVNRVAEELFGRPAAELIGRTDAELFEASLAAALRAAEQQALSLDGTATTVHRLDLGAGRRDLQATRRYLFAADGKPVQLLCGWLDTTEQHRREAQLQAALEQLEQQQGANEMLRRELQDERVRDSTTGLYHRAHFEDQLRREVDLSSREHREFALVFVAIDALDETAKQHGPEGRQRVLEALGRLLRSNTRAMDAPCRLENENFAVLLSGVGLATAHARMEGLRRQCATQIVALAGQELHFSVSMGVASFPHTASTLEGLMEASEAALAEARRRGGNRVALASIRFDQ
jgi:diguanylate cyclase (GGDEF)-like protein